VGDFNEDGKADVSTFLSSGEIDLLMGRSNPAFDEHISKPMWLGNPSAAAVADVDKDGHADVIAVSPNNGTNTVSILLGDGQGGLSLALELAGLAGPITGLAVGDLNGDGLPDIVVFDPIDGALLTFLNTTGP
jgi:hypothetical protein